jgi:hypothetical protein
VTSSRPELGERLVLEIEPPRLVPERASGEHSRYQRTLKGESNMLYTLAVILLLLWLLGLVSSYTIGGLIHILLVVAVVMVLVRIIEGRRPL